MHERANHREMPRDRHIAPKDALLLTAFDQWHEVRHDGKVTTVQFLHEGTAPSSPSRHDALRATDRTRSEEGRLSERCAGLVASRGDSLARAYGKCRTAEWPTIRSRGRADGGHDGAG